MSIGIPQLIFIVITVVNVTSNVNKATYKGEALLENAVALALVNGLLFWGGFYTSCG